MAAQISFPDDRKTSVPALCDNGGMEIPTKFWERLAVHGSERRYPAGHQIMRQGEPPTHVVQLLAGRVKVVVHLPDGEIFVAAVRGPGETLGAMGVVTERPRSATVIALVPCHTRVLPAERFLALMSAPGVTSELFQQTLRRFAEGDVRRAEMATLPASGRVIHALLRLAYPGPGGRFELHLSQEEIGQAVGLSRSVTAAELARLRERGVLLTGRRRVVITDMSLLCSLAGFNAPTSDSRHSRRPSPRKLDVSSRSSGRHQRGGLQGPARR
ncbi:Crp/Fnr family transcriptional regulator [Thermomonospora cellulosilytica]|uniref:CRP-like cAMP-binding protein n=1 Tax=Thermomonospora cellulosilytica TaxID=1411118 RepID=A0A7W3R7Z2_9ACTN|nr:Crp/Fnr family transcriptional regulator [Thermomonospora cellulosilytica]MBA9003029.1 CRP-like cAMP-binding protein [Thermomonospora cellulosilytica]